MSYYRRHMFFCTNRREGDERPCCCNRGGAEAKDYVKARAKALGLTGPGGLRVNAAGCLDRCEEGPVAVVYPEGVWYTWVDEEDLDELVDEHLVHGREVERLKL